MDVHTKLMRQLAVARAFRTLLPTPCGCVPKIADCGCPETHCECELELEFCECSEDWDADESESFVARLATFYAEVDPANYAEPPPPTFPNFAIGIASRLDVMSVRAESGMGLHHADDIGPDDTKSGEGCEVGMNGAAKRTGAKEEPTGKNYRAQWKPQEKRTAGESA